MKAISVGVAAAVLLVSAGALAGYVYQPGVSIYGSSAYGTMAGTRFSSDGTQQIGCDTYAIPGSATQSTCWGETSSSQWKSCVTTDPRLVAAAGTVNSTSVIQFAVESDNYTCAYIYVGNSSPGIQ